MQVEDFIRFMFTVHLFYWKNTINSRCCIPHSVEIFLEAQLFYGKYYAGLDQMYETDCDIKHSTHIECFNKDSSISVIKFQIAFLYAFIKNCKYVFHILNENLEHLKCIADSNTNILLYFKRNILLYFLCENIKGFFCLYQHFNLLEKIGQTCKKPRHSKLLLTWVEHLQRENSF